MLGALGIDTEEIPLIQTLRHASGMHHIVELMACCNSVIITDIRAKGPDGKEVRLSPIPLTLN